jgi:hypothetical protein
MDSYGDIKNPEQLAALQKEALRPYLLRRCVS